MAFENWRIFIMLLGVTVTPLVSHARDFREDERNWWAVQPLLDPVIPEGQHPVDHFVEKKLRTAGLKMAAGASADELVRRIYFDLHGLPPSLEEARRFREDWQEDSVGAVARLIDDLLESPRYGERWGQHWLDVVRYADSDGYRADDFRPTAHQYRDYVIRAFHQDKPYDRFVREQLAGDEMAPDDPEVVVATGFLRNGVYEWNQRNAEMQREIMINEITNVTGEVFLGMGIGCARCHDHKFDPIRQKDYFAFQAFLSSVYWPDDRLLAEAREKARYENSLSQWKEATREVRDEMKSLVAQKEQAIYDRHVQTFPPAVQEMFAKPQAEQTSYERQIAFLVHRQGRREVRTRAQPEKILKKGSPEHARYHELERELATFDSLKPVKPPQAFVSTDTGVEAAEVILQGASVAPAFPGILGGGHPEITGKTKTTGRRSALASWMVQESRPLTARVMVNRIWQHHFERGLAPSPNDFGKLGGKPSHPALLDWLARELVKGGWSVKHLHRVIMTSRAYRQTARHEPGTYEERIDPTNRLLWRFPPKRLQAEQIRDAMLSLSGELQHRVGGAALGKDAPVRSIYLKKMRNAPGPIFQCFDRPQGFASQPERVNTTTATQSLFLANSEWPLARARAMARRVLGKKVQAGRNEIATACEMAWNRAIKPAEMAAARSFLESQRDLVRDQAGNPHSPPENPRLAEQAKPGETTREGDEPAVDEAFVDFCHALLSSNEFLYLH